MSESERTSKTWDNLGVQAVTMLRRTTWTARPQRLKAELAVKTCMTSCKSIQRPTRMARSCGLTERVARRLRGNALETFVWRFIRRDAWQNQRQKKKARPSREVHLVLARCLDKVGCKPTEADTVEPTVKLAGWRLTNEQCRYNGTQKEKPAPTGSTLNNL